PPLFPCTPLFRSPLGEGGLLVRLRQLLLGLGRLGLGRRLRHRLGHRLGGRGRRVVHGARVGLAGVGVLPVPLVRSGHRLAGHRLTGLGAVGLRRRLLGVGARGGRGRIRLGGGFRGIRLRGRRRLGRAVPCGGRAGLLRRGGAAAGVGLWGHVVGCLGVDITVDRHLVAAVGWLRRGVAPVGRGALVATRLGAGRGPVLAGRRRLHLLLATGVRVTVGRRGVGVVVARGGPGLLVVGSLGGVVVAGRRLLAVGRVVGRLVVGRVAAGRVVLAGGLRARRAGTRHRGGLGAWCAVALGLADVTGVRAGGAVPRRGVPGSGADHSRGAATR